LFVTAGSIDEYAEEKTTEKNLIVRSGISKVETTNNKRHFVLKLYRQKASRGLCDSRASCLHPLTFSDPISSFVAKGYSKFVEKFPTEGKCL